MIVALVLMRPSELQRPERDRREGKRIRQAFDYVWSDPALRTPLLMMAVLGTLGFNFPVIMPLLARYTFGGHVSAYSLLMIAMGIGAIAASLIVGARKQLGMQATIAGASAFGVAGLLAAAAPSLALELPALALLGAASVVFAASINTSLQLAAEPQMRGRVMALYSIVFIGSTPIGGPIAGWLAEAVSPRAALTMGAITAFAVALGGLAVGRRAEGRARAQAASEQRRERQAGIEPAERDVLAPEDPTLTPATGELAVVAIAPTPAERPKPERGELSRPGNRPAIAGRVTRPRRPTRRGEQPGHRDSRSPNSQGPRTYR